MPYTWGVRYQTEDGRTHDAWGFTERGARLAARNTGTAWEPQVVAILRASHPNEAAVVIGTNQAEVRAQRNVGRVRAVPRHHQPGRPR